GHNIVDEGDKELMPDDDYPQFAARVAADLLGEAPDARGILICGSGQGMCIAANRFKGIRAALCWSQDEARAARNDDDANVLCLASRYTSLENAVAIVETFLSAPFAGAPRFQRRIKQLDELT
ncbi:MAG TPA: RpiB/LacA/LacB family sugar-phosphate isomerase, partial [Candidatus Saccharimonadales bacterium]|nr:RpiB/LacA/LacB family sugar-phosphate isomerase [Candidatus Saccharimonadales bacterium]